MFELLKYQRFIHIALIYSAVSLLLGGCNKNSTGELTETSCKYERVELDAIDRTILKHEFVLPWIDKPIKGDQWVNLYLTPGIKILTVRSMEEFGNDDTRIEFSSGVTSPWIPHHLQYSIDSWGYKVESVLLYYCERTGQQKLLLFDYGQYIVYDVDYDSVIYSTNVQVPENVLESLPWGSNSTLKIKIVDDSYLFEVTTTDTIFQAIGICREDSLRNPLRRDSLIDYDVGSDFLNGVAIASTKTTSVYPIHRVNTYTNDAVKDTLKATIDWNDKTYAIDYTSQYYSPEYDTIYFSQDTLHFSWSNASRWHVNCTYVHNYDALFVYDPLYGEAMCISLEERIENGQSCECDGVSYFYDLSDYRQLSLKSYIESFEADYFSGQYYNRVYQPKDLYEICLDTNLYCANWLPGPNSLRTTIKQHPISRDNLLYYTTLAAFFKREAEFMIKSDYKYREKVLNEAIAEFNTKD
jgi:hypothetical protein